MEFVNSMPYLNLDIVKEILTRLDARSLTRFKLVSNYWYAYLSHPSFSRFYASKKTSNSITGFFYKSSKTYHEKLQFVPLNPNQEPLFDPPSCLGFLDSPAILRHSSNGLLHWSTSDDVHFISNPLTHKFIKFSGPIKPRNFFACGIAFDPSVSDHVCFVILVLRSSGVKLDLDPSSSERMDWSSNVITLDFGERTSPHSQYQGVYLNGWLYWELKNNSLLAYDVQNQSSCVVHLPEIYELGRKLGFSQPGCLGFFQGRLHYCRTIGTVLHVWATTQESPVNSMTWVDKHMIDLSEVMCERLGSMRRGGSQALAFVGDCEGVLLGFNGKVFQYEFRDRVVREVCKLRGSNTDADIRSMFFPFVHSIALFNFSG